MTNYAHVRRARETRLWWWGCQMCGEEEIDLRNQRRAMLEADRHARHCDGVAAAQERDALRMKLHDALTKVRLLRDDLARVDAAIANHPNPGPCDAAAEGATCGWKVAYQDVLKARTDR